MTQKTTANPPEPLWPMAEQLAGKLETLAALLAVFSLADTVDNLSEAETVALMALGFDMAHDARAIALDIMNADLARVRSA